MELLTNYVYKLQSFKFILTNMIIIFGILFYQKLHLRRFKWEMFSIFYSDYFIDNYVKFFGVVIEFKSTSSREHFKLTV